MKPKTVTVDGRPSRCVGHPWQPVDRVATVGWISIALVVVAALAAAFHGPA